MSLLNYPVHFISSKTFTNPQGTLTTDASKFLLALFNRTGGGAGGESVAVGVTAAGSSQADAFQLTADWNYVESVPAGSGVSIPPINVGADCIVFNADVVGLNVYPPLVATASGGPVQIDALAANAPYVVAAGRVQVFRMVKPSLLKSMQLGIGPSFISGNYTVQASDTGQTFGLGGHVQNTITFGDPATFPNNFSVFLVNVDIPSIMSVSGAVAGTGGVVRLTVNSTAGIVTGDMLVVTQVTGTTEANGNFLCTVVDATHVELQGTTFVNAYVSGGLAIWQGRAKSVDLDGTVVLLWPGQSGYVFVSQGLWVNTFPARWSVGFEINIFVDPAGNDANDGLAFGTANAMLNIQTAVNTIHHFIDNVVASNIIDGVNTFEGNNVVLAAGTYNVPAQGIQFFYPQSNSLMRLLGNTNNPASYIVQCASNGICIDCEDTAVVSLEGLSFSTAGGTSSAVFVRQFAICDIGSCNFGTFTGGILVNLENHASCNVSGNCAVNGNCAQVFASGDQSFLGYPAGTCTVAAITVAGAFCVLGNYGEIELGCTFAGAGAGAGTTGQKWVLTNLSLLNLNGSTVPGSVAGTPASGAALVRAGLVNP